MRGAAILTTPSFLVIHCNILVRYYNGLSGIAARDALRFRKQARQIPPRHNFLHYPLLYLLPAVNQQGFACVTRQLLPELQAFELVLAQGLTGFDFDSAELPATFQYHIHFMPATVTPEPNFGVFVLIKQVFMAFAKSWPITTSIPD
jgi:hypothetical protein